MSDNPVPERAGKAVQTRETILEAALELFARKGYNQTTLRDIAASAGCSLGLTYRYFARKEELILELYRRLARELNEEVDRLPRAKLAARFGRALDADLKRLAPHRAALGALFGAGLSPDSEVALLGERVDDLRALVWSVWLRLITGSSDAPALPEARNLAAIFYAVHLSLVLFWLQDRSPNQKKTRDLVAFARDMIRLLRPALGLPPVSRAAARLARIFTPMFGPPPVEKDEG
ncbi:MAG TPA: TetR/AcrR family transcriptional regulator [Armatimonadota bacterium]|nr:TetR/AcrR family transcriptional regulator [Armatimonadota bacterium]